MMSEWLQPLVTAETPMHLARAMRACEGCVQLMSRTMRAIGASEIIASCYYWNSDALSARAVQRRIDAQCARTAAATRGYRYTADELSQNQRVALIVTFVELICSAIFKVVFCSDRRYVTVRTPNKSFQPLFGFTDTQKTCNNVSK